LLKTEKKKNDLEWLIDENFMKGIICL